MIGKKVEQGFTLIELLVVVAIIGILASVVLISMHDTHVRGREAAALSALAHARAGAELVFTNNGNSYTQVCPTDVAIPVAGTNASVILIALQGIAEAFEGVLTGGGVAGDNYEKGNGNSPNATGDIGCESDDDEYMIQVYFSTGRIACVDNRGNAGFIAAAKVTNLASDSIRCR